MTEQKKLTRREAIKILGTATGAVTLANLPAKWSRPELSGGYIPAHAQTSCYSIIAELLSTDGEFGVIYYQDATPPDSENFPFAYWDCRSGCFDIDLFLTSGTFLNIRFTTLTGQFEINLTFPGNIGQSILIDMATGEYELNFPGSTTDCTFFVPGEEPFTERAKGRPVSTGTESGWRK